MTSTNRTDVDAPLKFAHRYLRRHDFSGVSSPILGRLMATFNQSRIVNRILPGLVIPTLDTEGQTLRNAVTLASNEYLPSPASGRCITGAKAASFHSFTCTFCTRALFDVFGHDCDWRRLIPVPTLCLVESLSRLQHLH